MHYPCHLACRVAGAYRLLLVVGLLVFSCFVLLACIRLTYIQCKLMEVINVSLQSTVKTISSSLWLDRGMNTRAHHGDLWKSGTANGVWSSFLISFSFAAPRRALIACSCL
eukprot:scaffold387_cov266-Chaetoceros_neogracile.AAC.12